MNIYADQKRRAIIVSEPSVVEVPFGEGFYAVIKFHDGLVAKAVVVPVHKVGSEDIVLAMIHAKTFRGPVDVTQMATGINPPATRGA